MHEQFRAAGGLVRLPLRAARAPLVERQQLDRPHPGRSAAAGPAVRSGTAEPEAGRATAGPPGRPAVRGPAGPAAVRRPAVLRAAAGRAARAGTDAVIRRPGAAAGG